MHTCIHISSLRINICLCNWQKVWVPNKINHLLKPLRIIHSTFPPLCVFFIRDHLFTTHELINDSQKFRIFKDLDPFKIPSFFPRFFYFTVELKNVNDFSLFVILIYSFRKDGFFPFFSKYFPFSYSRFCFIVDTRSSRFAHINLRDHNCLFHKRKRKMHVIFKTNFSIKI